MLLWEQACKGAMYLRPGLYSGIYGSTCAVIRNFSFHKLYIVHLQMSGMELRVGNKYRLGRKIGSGSFGDIYLGKWY